MADQGRVNRFGPAAGMVARIPKASIQFYGFSGGARPQRHAPVITPVLTALTGCRKHFAAISGSRVACVSRNDRGVLAVV